MRRKLLAVFLATSMIVGTSNIAFAQDMPDTELVADGSRAQEDGGAQYNLTGKGSVNGIKAVNGAKVTVDRVEKKYIRDSDSERYRGVCTVQVRSGSEVTIAGDLDVSTEGKVGTEATYGVWADEHSKVVIKGDIKMNDNLTYVMKYDDRYPNECSVSGMYVEDTNVDVGGNIDIQSTNGTSLGVDILNGESRIHGTISASAECYDQTARGAVVNGYAVPSRLIVDGDINVNGGCNDYGLGAYGNSTTYIKGNVTVEANEMAYGVNMSDDALVIIDGVLSVKAKQKNSMARPYDQYETNGSDSSLYVYQYVDRTQYDSFDNIPGFTMSEEDSNYSHMKYIIKTDKGLTTNSKTFSDKESGISEFFYASEGQEITVSSDDGRKIHGIKNADSNININARNNGNGTWTITVPKGGGVHLQPIYEHSVKLVPQKDATCTSNGVKAYYECECGMFFADSAGTNEISDLATGREISATGKHTWNAGTVTKKATLKTTGKKTFTCKNCGKKKTETIAKLKKQTITIDKAVSKTVTVAAKKLTKNKTYSIKAKAKTTLSYKVTSTPKKAAKYISVSSKGKLTLKKKAPKGTYVVTVTAKEAKGYAKATKKITIKVK